MKHTPGRNGVRGAVTPAQLYRLGGAPSQSWSTPGTNLNKLTYTRVTANYTADGALFFSLALTDCIALIIHGQ